jgi:nitrate reductase gamma subunit
VVPVRDGSSGRVAWQRAFFPGTVSELHNFAKPEGQGCARCHFDGNQIGAATMILPAKSVICMPCHPATLTLKDSTSIIAFAVCLAGLLGFMTLWFSGTLAGARGASVVGNAFKSLGGALATLFSSKGVPIVKAVWYDAILQRRLYRRSAQRWAFHALIFWPFVIRFVWGALALFATNWLKDWPLAWALINKNHPAAAFIFDFTGLCLGLGLVLALWRGSAADQTRTAGLPKQDGVALGLLLGIVAVGFILEGMRIAMTGAQGGAAWAFIGNGLSALFSGMSDLTRVYGFVWYAHAVLTGAFVAYLPFSRMMHIIMSPVVIAVNAGTEEDHH